MELREWIILLLLVLVAVVIFDAFRRYRKQQGIPQLDDQLVDNESDEARAQVMDWELPNGGARVVDSARVSPPDLQGSTFERRGLKTRIPYTQEAALSSFSTRAAPAQTHQADGANAPADATAHAAVDARNKAPSATAPSSTGAAAHADQTAAAPAQNGQAPAHDASGEAHADVYGAPDSVAQGNATDDHELADEGAPATVEERRRRGFFDSEEEEIDDPRYEGLSEILVRRPMDGVARFQEAAAERRERRAAKREEARIKRHEERARRAEEKERRRQEREEEQRRREQEQRQREAEARQREQEALKQRRQYEAERSERQRQEDERNERLRREYEEHERHRHAQLRDADTAHRARDHEDEVDDPLFAPSRHGYGDEPQDAAARRGVPYLGAVDTFDEGHYDSHEPSPRHTNEPYADADAALGAHANEHGSYPAGPAHQEHEGTSANASERNWVRDLPEPESRMHPIIERALRHSVSGEEAREVLGEADELIMINVVAQPGVRFEGLELTRLLLACGLVFAQEGEMFHRFETEDPDSPLQFSVINALKPGRFPMLDIEKFSTRCISFLLPLPSADDSSGAFEAMYETARAVVRNLHGELRDENQSVMTAQTADFVRQRVNEFERRRHLYRNSR